MLKSVIKPLVAMLVQMAISRGREYGADETGAAISGDPLSLASALRKLERGAERIPLEANPATAHMFIVSPLTGILGLGAVTIWAQSPLASQWDSILGLWAWPPPWELRLERLRSRLSVIAYEAIRRPRSRKPPPVIATSITSSGQGTAGRGLGLAAPLFVGAPMGMAIGIILGAPTGRLLLWTMLGIVFWSAGLTYAATMGLNTLQH